MRYNLISDNNAVNRQTGVAINYTRELCFARTRELRVMFIHFDILFKQENNIQMCK